MLLGIDLGTSSVKAALYELDGRLVASSAAGYPTDRKGSAEEQDPQDWVRALRQVLAEVLPAGSPAALSVTGQMSGLLLTDRNGDPVIPFLPWSDRRAEREADWVAERFGAMETYRVTGCRVTASYPAAKLRWVQVHRPERWSEAEHISGAREHFLYLLTGNRVIDPSTAGASQFYNLHDGGWWQPMLGALGIAGERLPEVRVPWTLAGVTGPWAESVGLPPGIPVAAGAGDGACSSWGAGARDSGDVVISIGTSGVVRTMADAPLIHPAAATTCYPLGAGLYAGTGVISAAGAALEWVARLLGLPGVANLEEIALEAPPGAEGAIFVPDLSGSRTPFWDAAARGVFTGLELSHGRAHLARAAIEGVALGLTVALEALREAGARPARLLLTGGGSRNRLLARTLAGLNGLPAFVVQGGDATLGAAQLAAIAAGFYPDMERAGRAMAPALERVEPEGLPSDLTARYWNVARANHEAAYRPGTLPGKV